MNFNPFKNFFNNDRNQFQNCLRRFQRNPIIMSQQDSKGQKSIDSDSNSDTEVFKAPESVHSSEEDELEKMNSALVSSEQDAEFSVDFNSDDSICALMYLFC